MNDVPQFTAVELVGTSEIAKLAGVETNTVNVWKNRGLMPSPLAVLSCGTIWNKATIETWLKARKEARKMSNNDPYPLRGGHSYHLAEAQPVEHPKKGWEAYCSACGWTGRTLFGSDAKSAAEDDAAAHDVAHNPA